MMLSWILVGVFGGIGAYGRYRTETALIAAMNRLGLLRELADEASITEHTMRAWPIMSINTIGCFAAGLFTSCGLAHSFWALPIATGLLGGWTTFSTAMMDAYMILNRHERHPLVKRTIAAVIVAFATLFICVLSAMLGLTIGK